MLWAEVQHQRYSRRSQQQLPLAGQAKNWTDGSIDRQIDPHHPRHGNWTRYRELGGGVESGDGGDCVIGVKEL